MKTAQEIYDNTPFEDEYGLIPHDKLAVKVAEEYHNQFINGIFFNGKYVNDLNEVEFKDFTDQLFI